ncbi:MAG: monovalent cation/H(+) antiporter subunit G [Chthoniobacterales bacterium]
MISWIINILALAGAFFIFVAGLGIFRLSDIFLRMHAATKASSLGLGLLLLALILVVPELGVAIKASLMILFIFLTSPIAAHMIGRAAYFHNTPMADNTKLDELKDKYADDHSKLDS